MAAAFPLIKLASIAINFASKPLAEAAKRKAKESPFFRNYICIPPANLYHWCEVKMTMLGKNITGKEIYIPQLKESKAIELGAGLVGDAVIFLVGSSIFVLEYFRRSNRQHVKEMKAADQMKVVISDLQTLFTTQAELQEKVNELVRIIECELGVTIEPRPIPLEDVIPEHHLESEEEDGSKTSFMFKSLDYIVGKMI